MRFTQVLPLAAAATAFVVPDERVLKDVAIETKSKIGSVYESLPSTSDILDSIKENFDEVTEVTKSALDEAVDFAARSGETAYDKIYEVGYDAEAWFQSAKHSFDDFEAIASDGGRQRHRRPHHGHGKPNKTVYELIAESKYTTKLAKLINDNEDLVELLNGTSANFTVFAPTDRAFAKIPKHAPEPTPEQIKALLSYHVSPEFYPAGRVLKTGTIPSLLKEELLGTEPLPQRLSVNIGLRGLTINFYSRVVAIDILATNGVIHGVDSLILPPPRALKIIDLLPSEFSTLELGLGKTGLLEKLNATDPPGGTLFAPSNGAFRKLGARINAFLFSRPGLKYLEALLKYHVAPAKTLYSDAFYEAEADGSEMEKDSSRPGYVHVDLPTLLTNDDDEPRSLAVDIARYGPIISIKVNAFADIVGKDAVAKDGVIHVPNNVLIPPKRVSSTDGGAVKYEQWNYDDELTVEELTERLAPFVKEDSDDERWDL
ncbi:MAG: hypothetical protein M1822_001645 [Bathelium mastoideum]|nr:MAG: hypothetical protein M1822_001645 [Bathelium mastoideum]